MPSKKKKYNSRFPPARIKKIMQSDEEVGKVAQVVPIIISKALEIFVASLLRSSSEVTRSRNARTLTPNHIKASILSDDQFHFLREIAQTISDVNPTGDEEEEGFATASAPQTAAPRLQRKISQNKSSSSSGTTQSATATATTVRARGRPRKRPLESQISLSSLKTDPEDDEEEEEDDEDEDTEPDDSESNLSQQVIENIE